MSTSSKKQIIRLAKLLAAAVICWSIYSATSHYQDELRSLTHVNAALMMTAFAMCLVYRIANAHGWSIVLSSLGHKMPAVQAIRIWISSEACRWLPGSVWSYGSRALQASRQGATPICAAASLALEMLLTISAWVVAAAVGMFFYRAEFADQLREIPIQPIGIGLLVAGAMGAALLWVSKPLYQRMRSKVKGLRDKVALLGTLKINRRRAMLSGIYYCAMCLLNGLVCALVVKAVAPSFTVPTVAIIGINAAAWLIGFFAFLAPGGLVVREGALAALLTVWMPADQAITIAIAWRMLQIGAEVFCMGCVWLLSSCVSDRKHAMDAAATV